MGWQILGITGELLRVFTRGDEEMLAKFLLLDVLKCCVFFKTWHHVELVSKAGRIKIHFKVITEKCRRRESQLEMRGPSSKKSGSNSQPFYILELNLL